MMTFKESKCDLIPFESERVVTKFAFLPININGTIKWLERVNIKQQYQVGGAADVIFAGWVNLKFIKDR